jgi:hypothetical protein
LDGLLAEGVAFAEAEVAPALGAGAGVLVAKPLEFLPLLAGSEDSVKDEEAGVGADESEGWEVACVGVALAAFVVFLGIKDGAEVSAAANRVFCPVVAALCVVSQASPCQ